jgi:hypothetical protein
MSGRRRTIPGLLYKICDSKISKRTSTLRWDSLMDSPIGRVRRSTEDAIAVAESTTAIADSLITESADGVKLCVFLKGGLSWPWGNNNYPVEETTAAIEELSNKFPPPPPKLDDIRHTTNYHLLWRRFLGSHVGVYHLCMWIPQGQAGSGASRISELSGVVLSWDIVGAVYKVNVRRIAPLIQTLGILFEAMDREQYTDYLNNYSLLPRIVRSASYKRSEGETTGFLHMDLNLNAYLTDGSSGNRLTSSLFVDDEHPEGCTLVVKRLH